MEYQVQNSWANSKAATKAVQRFLKHPHIFLLASIKKEGVENFIQEIDNYNIKNGINNDTRKTITDIRMRWVMRGKKKGDSIIYNAKTCEGFVIELKSSERNQYNQVRIFENLPTILSDKSNGSYTHSFVSPRKLQELVCDRTRKQNHRGNGKGGQHTAIPDVVSVSGSDISYIAPKEINSMEHLFDMVKKDFYENHEWCSNNTRMFLKEQNKMIETVKNNMWESMLRSD